MTAQVDAVTLSALLTSMGIDKESLLAAMSDVPRSPAKIPTVAEFMPVAMASSSSARTLDTYTTYWNLFLSIHGDSRLDDISVSSLRAVAKLAKEKSSVRRNSQGGYSAETACISALRNFYRLAVEDGYLEKNPASSISKPRRPVPNRRALTDMELAELDRVTRTGGNDPLLDTLLLRFHIETGARRGGALALRLADLDDHMQCVQLHEKGNKSRWQPVSRTLLKALRSHADSRGATETKDKVFRVRRGLPISESRFKSLTDRWQRALPWAATYGISPHWLRHTAITRVERASSHAVAKAFAGHAGGDVTGTYTRAEISEVAAVVAALTGEPHPLAGQQM